MVWVYQKYYPLSGSDISLYQGVIFPSIREWVYQKYPPLSRSDISLYQGVGLSEIFPSIRK